MNIDLSLIPNTFDAVHATLAATIVGLLILQILFLTIAIMAMFKKYAPAETRKTAEKLVEAAPAPLRERDKPVVFEQPSPTKTETVVVREPSPDAALQLLGLLQTEARFIDFVQENVSAYSDAEIGAAARVVHEGCSKVIRQHFELEPVRSESEGSRVTLNKGFDASAVRLTGNIVGEAPFTGTLVHRGCRVKKVKLPKITEGHDARIIAAAEVEL